jgi:trimeric autotransporter adhesin
MKSNVTATAIATATAFAIAGFIASCGGDDPPPMMQPTVSVASVSLNPSTVTLPATSAGRVTLSGAANSSGATVSLRSSDTSQATVPASVTIAAGGTTADFTVTAVAAGSPRIEATFNGTQGATLTISAPAGPTPSLASLGLAPSTVVGGNAVEGTVTLSAPAPAGGATVTLTSSDQGVAAVPSSVTVAAGATSATFSITTRAVGGTFQIVITASFGATRTANLAVTPLTAVVAMFSVVGSGNANRCDMSTGGINLTCTFDGRASTGTGLSYNWTITLANQSLTPTGVVVTDPLTGGCSFFNGVTTKTSGAPVQMMVTLRVTDSAGNSATATNNNVVMFPLNNTCGFVF